METTRRDFIKRTLLLGGTLLFYPAPLYATKKEEGWRPAYAKLEEEGKFARKIEEAYSIFEDCHLCPRQCGVNRQKGEKGFCRAPLKPVVFGAHPHFGEEVPLVGRYGSGTIFISNCNLRCIFCQNWPIAHEGKGKEIGDEDLAGMMLNLQEILNLHRRPLLSPLSHLSSRVPQRSRPPYT